MKKTLIALALTTLPVAAMAEVVLYGQIKAGYEASTTKVTDRDRGPVANGLADFGSRIGFKGSEDLGNGLKAIWQVENKTPVAGGGSWATRDTFIGLEGGFGKVRAGTISNQFNSDMGDVNPWEYANPALGLDKFVRTEARRVSVRYDSPEIAGFSGNVQFSPRDNNNADRYVPTEAKYGLGLNYTNSGFFGKYGFELLKNNAGEDLDGQVHRLEGGYDANNIFVALGYQNAKNIETYAAEGNGRIAAVRGQEVALTGGYHFGNVFPKLSYVHGWDVKDTTGGKAKLKNTKYDQIVLGADYDFSKRTTAMVSAGWLREGLGNSNRKSTTTALGVGLRHKF